MSSVSHAVARITAPHASPPAKSRIKQKRLAGLSFFHPPLGKRHGHMTEADPPPSSPPRTAVKNPVAGFRAARIRKRPPLLAELRAERAALRRQRLNRLKTPPDAPAPPQTALEEQAPAPAEPPKPPPLSAIGFGPGMIIRLRQLGIETAADLAAADPAALRTALGDITRLINVHAWIATAQKAVGG
jgi:predicted flap endonuclease-1-like 5' DNA nuclease